ncbi:PREDICTED: 39S ribosomal protein L43, mitochondrial [Dufourea novaeangliae]|uniref:Large ribosomal subunit protein mL43 n=1 Tax=Dufourea novaeangliae TaxID=178035 RepID=A0A154PML8_DUFNO|nr:PREDICTED: 39S ribosomal protein L43, mitochondrial [Dufourea novaeangliae]KZC13083.1 39S ribosomal protein L43, mitochondrial [Dufourea novaeangliae]
MSHANLFLKAGYLRAPFGLGIGRYVCQLQRVTLKFCKNHGASMGLRKFLENDLIDYAKENPGVVVYVKPRRHRSPVIKAEYLNGETQWMGVANYSREDIFQWMQLLKTQYHDGTSIRLMKLWRTDFPSIQGPWTPFTFKEPSVNHTQLPDKQLSEFIHHQPTATEEVIRLFKEQQENEKMEGEKKAAESLG